QRKGSGGRRDPAPECPLPPDPGASSLLVMSFFPALLLIMDLAVTLPAETRLKDLVSIEGVRDNQLVGYGVVVGLNKTGDKQQTIFSNQSLANMLQKMGVSVDGTIIKVADTAAVMVTAILPAFAQPGTKIDVTA